MTRTELLCAAAAKSLVAATWRYQSRAKSAQNNARTMTPTMLIRTRFSITRALQDGVRHGGHHVGPLTSLGVRGLAPRSAKPTIGNMIGATIASKSAGEQHDPQRPEREELLLADQGADPDEQQPAEDPAEAPEHRRDPPRRCAAARPGGCR